MRVKSPNIWTYILEQFTRNSKIICEQMCAKVPTMLVFRLKRLLVLID